MQLQRNYSWLANGALRNRRAGVGVLACHIRKSVVGLTSRLRRKRDPGGWRILFGKSPYLWLSLALMCFVGLRLDAERASQNTIIQGAEVPEGQTARVRATPWHFRSSALRQIVDGALASPDRSAANRHPTGESRRPAALVHVWLTQGQRGIRPALPADGLAALP